MNELKINEQTYSIHSIETNPQLLRVLIHIRIMRTEDKDMNDSTLGDCDFAIRLPNPLCFLSLFSHYSLTIDTDSDWLRVQVMSAGKHRLARLAGTMCRFLAVA